MPKKNYVFDTNVLIHDPKSIYRFQDNDVYIPIYVLEELDGLKNDPGERGRSARQASRAIDDIRARGSLVDGVKIHSDEEFLPEGMGPDQSGSLYVYSPPEKAQLEIAAKDSIDSCILQSALDVKEQFKSYKDDDYSHESDSDNYSVRTILVTMDINVRVRAEALGLQVAPYEFQSVDVTNLGNKVITLDIKADKVDEFHKKNSIPLGSEEEFSINSSILLRNEMNHKQTALARVKHSQGISFAKKVQLPPHVCGIKPRNAEQSFALDLLLDDDIKLVTIMGKAGCGKTLLTLAAGLYQVLEKQVYSKMLVSRPVVTMGKDIGYLPGSMEEKMDPWMQPVYDNLDYLMMSASAKKQYGKSYDDLFDEGLIEIEPLMYIRGRSIPNQFIIVDEAQNLTPHEVKTIITRCGENTKIVLTGDVHQIDNPYISSSSNGLSVTAKRMKDNHMVGHLALEKGERSALATLAADTL